MLHRLVAQTITDFGDAALLIPGAALVGVYLWFRGLRQTALVWATTFAVCILITVLLKIGFTACGGKLGDLGLRSPSGHVSLSLTFYGCLALLIGRSFEGTATNLIYALAALAALAIAASRLLLHAHNLAEVAVGSLIGIGCVVYFARRPKGDSPILGDWLAIGAAFVAIGIITHGYHIGTETLIVRLAIYVKNLTQVCVAEGGGAAAAAAEWAHAGIRSID